MVPSMWTSIASWFTPTILFCLLNLMIATIFFASNFKSHTKTKQPQLVRVPSLLDRVHSLNFSLYRFQQPDPFPPATQQTDPLQNPTQNDVQTQIPNLGLDRHVTRSKSDTCGETTAWVPAKMRTSVSEKVVAHVSVEDEEEVDRRVSETASVGEDEGVDAKADDFINRFKQQLKLQRLDSLLRYKEMLGLGSGK